MGSQFDVTELHALREILIFAASMLANAARAPTTDEENRQLIDASVALVPVEIRYARAVEAVVSALYAMPEYVDDVGSELRDALADIDVRFADLESKTMLKLTSRIQLGARGRNVSGPARCVAQLASQCGAFGTTKGTSVADLTKRITNGWRRARQQDGRPVEIEEYAIELVESMRRAYSHLPAKAQPVAGFDVKVRPRRKKRASEI